MRLRITLPIRTYPSRRWQLVLCHLLFAKNNLMQTTRGAIPQARGSRGSNSHCQVFAAKPKTTLHFPAILDAVFFFLRDSILSALFPAFSTFCAVPSAFKYEDIMIPPKQNVPLREHCSSLPTHFFFIVSEYLYRSVYLEVRFTETEQLHLQLLRTLRSKK